MRPRPSVRGAASRFLGKKAGTQPPHIAGAVIVHPAYRDDFQLHPQNNDPNILPVGQYL